MSRLPVVSGRELVKALKRLGYSVRDQKGSHVHLRHPDRAPLTVPLHSELDVGTLIGILRDAGIDRDRFLRILGKR